MTRAKPLPSQAWPWGTSLSAGADPEIRLVLLHHHPCWSLAPIVSPEHPSSGGEHWNSILTY